MHRHTIFVAAADKELETTLSDLSCMRVSSKRTTFAI